MKNVLFFFLKTIIVVISIFIVMNNINIKIDHVLEGGFKDVHVCVKDW